jgi:hypothetical protein
MKFGAKMGVVIPFISKLEQERAGLIREARAMYKSIFPPSDTVSEPPNTAPSGHEVAAPRLITATEVSSLD